MKATENDWTEIRNISNRIQSAALDSDVREDFSSEIGMLITHIIELGGFAAEIACTIKKYARRRVSCVGTDVYTYRISEKQAFCLARAAFENGIEF